MIRRSIQEKVITVEIYIVQSVNNLPAVQETWVQFLGWEDPLEEETATHSSVLAWRIPWTEEPGRLQSMGSQQSDTTERLSTHTHVFLTVLRLQCWVGFSPVTGAGATPELWCSDFSLQCLFWQSTGSSLCRLR